MGERVSAGRQSQEASTVRPWMLVMLAPLVGLIAFIVATALIGR